ncbi:SMI1/KNR4 family protein [Lentzea sp. NPDC006480]|uniref:SMI1/KNR4 family protein n=1 Tax=Lentzea sp. NPDC006480 TaxID=3157176 RepID=UPI0033ABE974
MQDKFAAVAREIIGFVEPGFDHLTLRASCSGGSSSVRLTSGPSEQDLRFFHQLTALAALGEERPVVFEMRIEADGTFEALAAGNIIQSTGNLPPTYTVVRKPRFQPNEHKASSLAEVEAVVGASLPPEVHELYASGAEMIGDAQLFRVDEILGYWSDLADIERYPMDWDRPVRYVGPAGAVRMVRFDPRWVPIASNDWGDVLCVDLAPGPRGKVGQLIQPAGEAPLMHLADSLADWSRSPEAPEHDNLEDHVDIADRGPEGVTALPDSLQKLTLRDPGDLDFGLLSRLTALRELTIVRGTSVRLGALAHLPLERIEVTGDEIEIPACETLTSLVAGGGARVEVPVLPNLRVLDVSGVEVDVASLPQVEYLVLNVGQWQRCTRTPAAASLTGQYSLARALDWARERGVDVTGEVFRGTAAS